MLIKSTFHQETRKDTSYHTNTNIRDNTIISMKNNRDSESGGPLGMVEKWPKEISKFGRKIKGAQT